MTKKPKPKVYSENPYIKKAQIWFETCPSKDMWSSHSPVTAVAEYMANQDGGTLWPKEVLDE